MDDMLTFISKHTKNVDGLSVKDIIAACQLTKSKFYRCVAEPFRFTDSQLDTIAKLLQLNDGERQRLLQFKHATKSDIKPDFYVDLRNMILGIYAFEDEHSSKPFVLYNQSGVQNSMGIYTANSLIDLFSADLADFSPENRKHSFEITIFNTYAPAKAKIIHTLLTNILNLDIIEQHHRVVANHFINSSEISISKQFRAFYNLYSMIGTGVYSIHFTNMEDTVLGSTNSALVQYINRRNQEAYILIHISKDSVSVYKFPDSNFSAFLLSNFEEYENVRKSKRLPVSDPIVANTILREASGQHDKIMISFELCFENFCLDLWHETTDYLRNTPQIIKQLRKHADPENRLGGYGDNQFVEVLFSGFATRGALNEQKEAISVIAATGLRDFAKEGYTSEMRETTIQLDVEQRIKQLQFIRSRLGAAARPKQQSFYLIDPMYSIPKRTFMIFKEFRIAMSFQESAHIDYTWKTLAEEEMATMFYEYVKNELLPTENREQFGSIVMSDSRAAVYIDDLISKLRSETTIV